MPRNKTILDAVVHVLETERAALSARQIYERIVTMNLYEFRSKDPGGMVRAALRKHLRSNGGAGQPQASVRETSKDCYVTAQRG
jgi:hypothetical protein